MITEKAFLQNIQDYKDVKLKDAVRKKILTELRGYVNHLTDLATTNTTNESARKNSNAALNRARDAIETAEIDLYPPSNVTKNEVFDTNFRAPGRIHGAINLLRKGISDGEYKGEEGEKAKSRIKDLYELLKTQSKEAKVIDTKYGASHALGVIPVEWIPQDEAEVQEGSHKTPSGSYQTPSSDEGVLYSTEATTSEKKDSSAAEQSDAIATTPLQSTKSIVAAIINLEKAVTNNKIDEQAARVKLLELDNRTLALPPGSGAHVTPLIDKVRAAIDKQFLSVQQASESTKTEPLPQPAAATRTQVEQDNAEKAKANELLAELAGIQKAINDKTITRDNALRRINEIRGAYGTFRQEWLLNNAWDTIEKTEKAAKGLPEAEDAPPEVSSVVPRLPSNKTQLTPISTNPHTPGTGTKRRREGEDDSGASLQEPKGVAALTPDSKSSTSNTATDAETNVFGSGASQTLPRAPVADVVMSDTIPSIDPMQADPVRPITGGGAQGIPDGSADPLSGPATEHIPNTAIEQDPPKKADTGSISGAELRRQLQLKYDRPAIYRAALVSLAGIRSAAVRYYKGSSPFNPQAFSETILLPEEGLDIPSQKNMNFANVSGGNFVGNMMIKQREAPHIISLWKKVDSGVHEFCQGHLTADQLNKDIVALQKATIIERAKKGISGIPPYIQQLGLAAASLTGLKRFDTLI